MKWFLLAFCVGCSAKSPTEVDPQYKVTIQPPASFQQTSPKHYDMTLSRSGGQTLARLDATTDAPDLTKFIWESDKTWEYVFVNEKFDVPTLNCCSYSYQNLAHTMLAPISKMVGDSMVVIVSGLVHEKYLTADTIVVRFK